MASNLKLALDEYDAQQRRQQALLEAQRIGTLIHIQEQQLVAAKHLAKQRKHARRQQQMQQQLAQQQLALQQQLSQQYAALQAQPTLEALAECAIEEEEEDLDVSSAPSTSASRVAARRAARMANKRSTLLPVEHQQQQAQAQAQAGTEPVSPTRYAVHKRRPQEPYAVLTPRCAWKPDSHTNRCDNILCRKEFTLFGEKRHHCRRCGNIFCAACLTHTEVLYDMRNASWRVFPERLLASIFPPDSNNNNNNKRQSDAPVTEDNATATAATATATAPAHISVPHPITTTSSSSSSSTSTDSIKSASTPVSESPSSLSSSFESGSSNASKDYFDRPHSSTSSSSAISSSTRKASIPQPQRPKNKKPYFERRKVIWESGTGEFVPSPVPDEWRNQVLDLATEEPVCDDCHCILWGVETPTDLYHQRKALMVEREEIAWALYMQGIDKWDACLRKHGLTLKKTVDERLVERENKQQQQQQQRVRRGSTFSSDSSTCSSQSVSTPVVASDNLDYAGRPMHADVYAWPTAPDCIRFTTAALKPAPPPAPKPKPVPSIFGMQRSLPRYIPTPTPPPQPVLSASELEEKEERERERIEEDRQRRYKEALEEFIGDAYAMGDLNDSFRRRIYYPMPIQPTKWESIKDDLWRVGMDCASRWRGDSWGGW